MRTARTLMIAIALALLGVAGVGPAGAQDKVPGGPADVAFWTSVKDSRNPAEIKAYLEAFPNGAFAALAKIRLQGLERPASASPPAAAPRPSPGASVLSDAATVREVQQKLYDLNYDLASVNGRMSDETRSAIRTWQTNTKRPVTGDMDAEQVASLRSARIPTIWGAMAYAAKGASGTVWSRASRQDAERDAILECRNRGGSGCKVVAAAGSGCGALGFYSGRVGTTQHWGTYASVRPTLAQAVENALQECRRQSKKPDSCGVRITFCANGSHKK